MNRISPARVGRLLGAAAIVFPVAAVAQTARPADRVTELRAVYTIRHDR